MLDFYEVVMLDACLTGLQLCQSQLDMGWLRLLIFFGFFFLGGIVGAQESGAGAGGISLEGDDGRVRLGWDGEQGTTFFPQYSSSLKQWGYFDELYFGEGAHLEEFEEGPVSQFFRICSIKMPVVSSEEARVADFDQDGLTNEDEIGRVGSDPLIADSDGDGLPDGWEDVHGLNVLDDGTLDPNRGPDADFRRLANISTSRDVQESPPVMHAPLSNMEAFNAGVQAHPAAGPDDLDGDGIANGDDADPDSGMIAWRKRDWPTQFAFMHLEGWDRSSHGYVRSINNRCEVLADKAVYTGGNWVGLRGIRSASEGPPTPMNYKFLVDGRLHSAGLLNLSRAGSLSDEGIVVGNGRVVIFPLSVEDPESGEITIYNPGSRPEFAFAWRGLTARPEILGRDEAEPIEGMWHKETAAMARDGSVVVLQKQFEAGIPFSNDYRMTLTDSKGGVRTSEVLSSPGLPKRVEADAMVAFGTFSYPPATYRGWTWTPGESHPRTLWAGWQLRGDAPPTNYFPEVIGRLPGGSVCISVGGRTFVQQEGRWHEVPGMEGVKLVSPSGVMIVDRPLEAEVVWNGEEEASLVELTGGDEGSGAEFVVEDLNDEGVALARLIAPGEAERVGLLIPAEMVPDYNRDGRIDDLDRGKVSPGNPWRWWVNDDDDYAEDSGTDVPASPQPDGMNTQVDGMRDLIDFFPLHLDLRQLLELMPAADFEYRLCHDERAFKLLSFAAANLVPQESSLTVNAHITNVARGRGMERQGVDWVDESGVALSSQFLKRAKEGEGVVLLEARSTTSEPLRLEVRWNGDVKATIEFPVLVSNVEAMFRHVDLTGLPRNYDGSAPSVDLDGGLTRTVDPGTPYPDALSNGKYFVFLHGFNVSPRKARGWHAEVFKRLHQMGSRARFVGVTWNGDTGIPGAIPDLATTDYHKAAFFALQTGDALPAALQFTEGADVTVAAHSLGNLVVSQAIEGADFTPARYYLINGAVAREAYGASSVGYLERRAMTQRAWKPFDDIGLQRLFAANWYQGFEDNPDDARGWLAWKDRFLKVVASGRAHNFYSPGDDVVQNPTTDSASVWEAVIGEGVVRGSWGAQEFVKGGTSAASIGQSRVQAGWGFNHFPPKVEYLEVIGGPGIFSVDVPPSDLQGYWKFSLLPPKFTRRYTPNEAMDEISVELQKSKPFFAPFLSSDLTDSTQGPLTASEPWEQYDLLASGIPAMSYAVAVNEVPDLAGNYDMELMKTDPSQWPARDGEEPEYLGDWLHSDFRDVSMNYLYKMYLKMIELGDLDS